MTRLNWSYLQLLMSSSLILPYSSYRYFLILSCSDTKLVAKSLISAMTTSAHNIYKKPQGLRALVYLLTSRSRRHLMPVQIVLLEETDAVRQRTSKKDSEARIAEICRFSSEALLEWIVQSGVQLLSDPRGSLITTEVMLYADGGLLFPWIHRVLADHLQTKKARQKPSWTPSLYLIHRQIRQTRIR